MKNISVRLMISLLTFAMGVAAYTCWHLLSSLHPNTPDLQVVQRAVISPQFNKYENSAIYNGLYSILRTSMIDASDNYDERALVFSIDAKSMESTVGESDIPILPGFYLSHILRFDFERVEVIDNKVYFKTRVIGGVSYEFSGISGVEIIPGFDLPDRVPFIKGILTRSRDGKVVEEEETKFRHAVIR